MDPITAVTNLITALTRLLTVAIEGQTPEQRKQMWDWYIADVRWWRKLFKLDESVPLDH
jgi:hypothetical protein